MTQTYRVFYNTHKYADMSDTPRSASRLVPGDSSDDAADRLRAVRNVEQDKLKPMFGSRFIGMVHTATLERVYKYEQSKKNRTR